MAFCRIADRAIRLREPVSNPDALIIQDPTLLHQVSLFEGLQPDGFVLINSTRSLDELGLASFLKNLPAHHALTVPATELALRHVGRPLPNSTLLGGFAAMTGELRLASVLAAIRQKFRGKIGESNAAAAQEAYDLVARSIPTPPLQNPSPDAREEIHVEAD
jgi:pyruvate ferredoxin oxidoreductase gamma subunit